MVYGRGFLQKKIISKANLKMQEAELYSIIRQEIMNNHNLMHWFTFFVVVLLLVGGVVVEKQKTVLSVFLPLISLAWAAAVVRFDFFIHRQGAYLKALESQMQNSGFAYPLWETWKSSHSTTAFIVPLSDIVIFIVIIVLTAYVLFGYTQKYFADRQWRAGKAYSWTVLISIIILLCLLPFIPFIAQK